MADQDTPITTDDQLREQLIKLAQAGASEDDLEKVGRAFMDTQHPFKSAMQGVVEGATSGVVAGATAPIMGPINVLSDLIHLATGGSMNDTKTMAAVDFVKGLPEKWSEAGIHDRAEMIATALSGFGAGYGTKEALTSGPVKRNVGRGLEYAGSRKSAPFTVGAMGAGGLGAALATGNPELAIGGLGTALGAAMLPRAMVRIGQKLQRSGGGTTLEEEAQNRGIADAMTERAIKDDNARIASHAKDESTMRAELADETKKLDAEKVAEAEAQGAFARDVNEGINRNVGQAVRIGARSMRDRLSDLDKSIDESKAQGAAARASNVREEAANRAAQATASNDVAQNVRVNVGRVVKDADKATAGKLSDLDAAINERKAEAAGTRAASNRARIKAEQAEDRADYEQLRKKSAEAESAEPEPKTIMIGGRVVPVDSPLAKAVAERGRVVETATPSTRPPIRVSTKPEPSVSTPSKSTAPKEAAGWTKRDFDAYDQIKTDHPTWSREDVLKEVDRQRTTRSSMYRSGDLKKE